MEKTKKINLNDAQASISKGLFDLLSKKVIKVNKKSTLQQLKENDIKELKNFNIILGVYSCKNDNNDAFLVYKIFISSDAIIKGSYKEFNLISNALLSKNKEKEKVTAKINIYNRQDNDKFYNTIIQFVKNKLNDEDIKHGEYELQGLKLADLLEIEI